MSDPAAHLHSSIEARRIAEDGTILRVQVGSGVHGTAIASQADRDEMGMCLEPPEYITGIARVPRGDGGEHATTVAFEQWEYRTAWEREQDASCAQTRRPSRRSKLRIGTWAIWTASAAR